MAKNNIQLSDHFHYRRLLRFTMPAILMLIFTSVYSIVDGFFVSNFTGKTPFAAVNFIMPLLMILGCAGFMFGTGGGALIAKTIGVGDRKGANELFSLVVYAAALSGVILAVFDIVFLRPLASLMGADGQLLEDSVVYGRIILLALPFYVLQYEFQCLFAAAEKPKLGLYVTVAAGIINIVLDALFVAILHWGLAGAAAATAVSQFAGGIVPIIYFARRNDSPLRLGKCRFDGFALAKTCTNGSSELMSNISASVVNILYNYQLMVRAGENGVAAYGVMMYMSFVFSAIYLGYAVGCAPVISYHFGAGNRGELRNLFWKSIRLNGAAGIVMIVTAQLAANPLMRIFVGYDGELFAMTRDGFRLYAMAFLITGLNIFGSAFFTALGNGGVSAVISFLRTLVFQVLSVTALPVFLGVNGIWLAVVVAEVLSLMVTAGFLAGNGKRYGYVNLSTEKTGE